jgi:FkbM family methyltransferase
MTNLSEKLAQSLSRKAQRRIMKAAPDKVEATFQRVKRWLPDDGLNTITHDQGSGMFAVGQDGDTLYIARKSRLRYHLKGLDRRRSKLMAEYLVPEGLIRPGDLVLDCGANIGEFSIAARKAGAEAIAFEPDTTELTALQRNAEAFGGITCLPYALWNDDTQLEFFDANDTGDSSLFDPGKAKGSTKVEARKLDTLHAQGLLPQATRLIKIEAEGAEPEIIEGGTTFLKTVDYITVDMGPERGLGKENTVAPVVRQLTELGFEMRDFGTYRMTGLFRRIGVNDMGQS